MTIKELEERSGLPRANIRFYEKEGLLTPARRENGYRDYSEDDLLELEKIKLLRALDLPLEDIRAAQAGQRPLPEVLDAHLPKLADEAVRLNSAQTVCRQLCLDGASYQSLDPAHYLDALHTVQPPEADRVPKVRSPWRRYFARMLDYSLCGLLVRFFYALLIPSPQSSAAFLLLQLLLSLGLVLLIEPYLLHWYGTTPGKYILGLSVTDSEGGLPSLEAARERTWCVLVHGMGLNVPIYALVPLFRNFSRCDAGEDLPWEYHTVLVQRDTRRRRTVVFSVTCALLFCISLCLFLYPSVPRNRGDLTVEEFSENFNQLAQYYDFSPRMAEDGHILSPEELEPNTFFIGGPDKVQQYQFTLDGDRITGISLHAVGPDASDIFLYDGDYVLRLLAILSFVQAQNGLPPSHMLDKLDHETFSDWTVEERGVRVVSQISYTGYLDADDWLLPLESEPLHEYELFFSLELVGR